MINKLQLYFANNYYRVKDFGVLQNQESERFVVFV